MGGCLSVGGPTLRRAIYHEDSDDDDDDMSAHGSEDGTYWDSPASSEHHPKRMSSDERSAIDQLDPLMGDAMGKPSPLILGDGDFDDGADSVKKVLNHMRQRGAAAEYLRTGPSDRATLTNLTDCLKRIVTLSQLPYEELMSLASIMTHVRVPAGTVLLNTGELMRFIYIVHEGALEKGSNVKTSRTRRLSTVGRFSTVKELSGAWELIGQVGHLGGSGRSDSNVFARADSTLWVIDRDTVLEVAENYARSRTQQFTAFLATVKLLDVLTEGERQQLASAMEVVSPSDGDYLFRHGDVGDALYIVLQGTVECLIPNAMNPNAPKKVIELHEGEVVGERALLNDRPRSADVVARGSGTKLLKLLRSDFDMLLGPLTEYMSKTENMYELRVLRETPGLQGLHVAAAQDFAAEMTRFKVEKNVVIGNRDPSCDRHDEYCEGRKWGDDVSRMPGLIIISQGEAELIYGHASDALLGTVLSGREDGLSNDYDEGILDKESDDDFADLTEGDGHDYLGSSSTNEVPGGRGATRVQVERGHVIGLQHILFMQRPVLLRSRKPLEYLFVPRAAVERHAAALAQAFGLASPSSTAAKAFLNECFVLDKLINREIDMIAPQVRREFILPGETLIDVGDEVSNCYYVSHGTFRKTTESPMGREQGFFSENSDVVTTTRRDRTATVSRRSSSLLSGAIDKCNSGLTGSTLFEDALMGKTTSDMKFRAHSFCVVLRLARDDLESSLGNSLASTVDCDEGDYRLRLLQSVPTLCQLPIHEQCKLAAAMKVRTYAVGQYIIIQGEEGDAAYIIKAGEANITITTPSRKKKTPLEAGDKGSNNDNGNDSAADMLHSERRMSEVKIAEIGRGAFVGESALLDNKPRNANVVAKTAVECYVVTSRLFHKHLETVKRDLKQHNSAQLQSREELLKKYYQGSAYELSVSMKDVDVLGFLGEGIVGKVLLIATRNTGQHYAVKAVQKKYAEANNFTDDIVTEVKLLRQLRSPFINSVLFTDSDTEYVFLGFDVLPGSDLYARLQSHGVFSEDEARFYAYGVMNALDYLHQRNIAHRDLKPENVAINGHGYPVLIDFGCAAVIRNQTMTICGTPLYCAPEVLTCKGHTTAVDCWSFGVMLYEFLSLETPFKTDADETVDDVYENIIDGHYVLPEKLSPEASSLLTDLLQVRVCKRLGARRGRWLDVRCHPFFAGKIDTEQANQQSLPSPWTPDIEEFTAVAKDNKDDAHLSYQADSPAKLLRKASITSQPEEPRRSKWDEVF